MTAPAVDHAFIAQEIAQYARDYEGTFAPSCIKILDKQKRLIALVPNPVQRAIGRAERRALKVHGKFRGYVLKGRQPGVTTDQQARAIHTIWSEPGSVVMTLAHTREATDRIFEITKRAIENFPPELLPMMGGKETREVSFPLLDTHFYTETAGAKGSVRGLTMNRLHGSEFAYWDDPQAMLTAAEPSMIPHGSVIILETTANAYGSPAHVKWLESEAGKSGYDALFFPWWECDPTHYQLPLLAPDELGELADDERELVALRRLSLAQIKWRRDKVRAMGGLPDFLQEYPEDAMSCWLASGGLFFDAKQLKALATMTELYAPTATDLNGTIEYYNGGTLPEGERAIGGMDTAEGGGGDSSTFTIRAFPSWKKLCVYKSADVEPKELARIANQFGRRFAGKHGLLLWVIEKNAHGITVLREMRDAHKYPTTRLYHRQTLDDEKGADVLGRIGWATTAESKPLMLDAARELFRAALDKLVEPPSIAAVREAFTVRRDKNGKIDLNGRDVLVSEMLCWLGRSYPLPTLSVY